MGKAKRSDMVNTARKVGRSDAIKKRYVAASPCLGFLSRRYSHIGSSRDMIAGSKRRKQKAQIINNIKQNDADDNE